tara:strand:- start:383 stop:565 length:183 start_codon:yes stop_codon:yes gene_type:complete
MDSHTSISKNTIDPIKISGEEFVIIKNLKKEYEKKKKEITNKIFEGIKENHLKDNTENNT